MSFGFKYGVKLVLVILGMGLFATTGLADEDKGTDTSVIAVVPQSVTANSGGKPPKTVIPSESNPPAKGNITSDGKSQNQTTERTTMCGGHVNISNMLSKIVIDLGDIKGKGDTIEKLKSRPVGITIGKSVCLALVVVFLLVVVTVPWAIKTDARMRVMENILKDVFERLGRIHPIMNQDPANNVGIDSAVKQSVEDACKSIVDKIDSLAATIVASKKEAEAKRRNFDGAVENAEAPSTFIGESVFQKNDKFAPLLNELKSWLSKGLKGADVVASSLGVFAVRESVDDDTWLLSLRNISHGLTAVSQSLGEDSSVAITRLATWSRFLADYSDGGKLFALQIPQIGSAVDFSWMTVTAGKEASRVASVKGWAVYTAYGVRYNAEVA